MLIILWSVESISDFRPQKKSKTNVSKNWPCIVLAQSCNYKCHIFTRKHYLFSTECLLMGPNCLCTFKWHGFQQCFLKQIELILTASVVQTVKRAIFSSRSEDALITVWSHSYITLLTKIGTNWVYVLLNDHSLFDFKWLVKGYKNEHSCFHV